MPTHYAWNEALPKLAGFSWLLGRVRLDGMNRSEWTIAFRGRATRYAPGHSLAAAGANESGCDARTNGAHDAAFASCWVAGLAAVGAESLLDDVAIVLTPACTTGSDAAETCDCARCMRYNHVRVGHVRSSPAPKLAVNANRRMNILSATSSLFDCPSGFSLSTRRTLVVNRQACMKSMRVSSGLP